MPEHLPSQQSQLTFLTSLF